MSARALSPMEEKVRRLLADGDACAAATLVLEVHGPGILGYLSSLLPGDDAYDAFSRFQENLWRGLPGFRWECSLRAWAYRIAWNAVARLARDGYRRRRSPLPSTSRLAPAAREPSLSCERRARLGDLAEALRPDERTLLTLRVDREMEWGEVAAVLSCLGEEVSPTTLRKRFERLKQRLVDLARERGLLA